MALSVQTCFAHIEDTLGDGELSTEISEIALINAAGQHMTSMHEWRYLKSNQATLSFVANQDFLDLPSDIKAIRAIESTNSLTNGIRLTSLQEVLERRTQSFPGSNYYDAAVIFVNDSTGVPQPKLALWPTPSADASSAVSLFYDKTWTQVETDSGLIPIPQHLELLYAQVLRAVCRGWIEEDEGALDPRLALIEGGPVFKAAKRADGQIQTGHGFPRGGVAGNPVGSLYWNRESQSYSGPE